MARPRDAGSSGEARSSSPLEPRRRRPAGAAGDPVHPGEQPRPVGPGAEAGGDVDVAGFAVVDQPGAPGGGQGAGTPEAHEGVGPAGDHRGRERQRRQRDRREGRSRGPIPGPRRRGAPPAAPRRCGGPAARRPPAPPAAPRRRAPPARRTGARRSRRPGARPSSGPGGASHAARPAPRSGRGAATSACQWPGPEPSSPGTIRVVMGSSDAGNHTRPILKLLQHNRYSTPGLRTPRAPEPAGSPGAGGPPAPPAPPARAGARRRRGCRPPAPAETRRRRPAPAPRGRRRRRRPGSAARPDVRERGQPTVSCSKGKRWPLAPGRAGAAPAPARRARALPESRA